MGMMIHRNRTAAAQRAVAESSPIAEKATEKKEATYSKKDIQFMKTEDLKALADELGLDAELSGTKLKPLICERLGL